MLITIFSHYLKALQKTKFWKILCIFWPGPSRPNFYYITHLCEIELSRKFDIFQIFHCKTMNNFQKSQFHIKNTFFWDTICWCGSKITRMVGGQICQFWLNWPPYHSCNFWATPNYCVSKEHIFDVELRFLKIIYGLTIKNLKKIEFSWKLNFT